MPVDYKDLKAIGGLFMLELQGKSVRNATFYRVSERPLVIRELRSTKRGVAGSFCRQGGVTTLTISPKWKRGSVHIDDGDASMTARSLRVGFLSGDKVWIEWGAVEGDGDEELDGGGEEGSRVGSESSREAHEKSVLVEASEERSILAEDPVESNVLAEAPLEEDDLQFFAGLFEEEAEGAATWKRASTTWADALETLADEVGRLQTAIRAAAKELDDEDLQNIADSGLAELTDGNRTKVQAAVFDVNGSTGSARTNALRAVQSAAQGYLRHIDTHPAFEAIASGVEEPGPPPLRLPAVDIDRLRTALKGLESAATAELAGTP